MPEPEMIPVTLCFPIREDQVLLGWKKRGLGEGKYAGFGGKILPGEDPVIAALRELAEEAAIQANPETMNTCGLGGRVAFIFPSYPAWNQVAHIYVVRDWWGEPQETAEMQPAWFPLDNLPFDQMWADNGYWLPAVLSGLQVEASFSFQVDQQTVDHYTLEYQRDSFIISTDRDRLDVDAIHTFLSTNSYWAQDRSRSVVEISIANSFCFGLYQGWKQIGFARVVTDYATFAWLCDVFIQKAYRGYGLGKWLVQSILHHPVVYSLRRVLLATRDAHGLYNKYGGFEPLRAPDRWMERLR